MQKSSTYCTFHVGRLLFGVEVKRVQEVLRHQRTTTVPLASSIVGGLMNLRGQIVTSLDLRKKLEMYNSESSLSPMNVVLRSEEGPVSLLVDGIGDVVELEDSELDGIPETLPVRIRETILGIHKLKDRLMLVLNPSSLDPHSEPARNHHWGK